MKRLTVFLIVTLLTLGVYAQNADNKWAIGLGPGVYWNLDKSEDNVGFLGELYLSRYLSPSFDLMLKGDGGWVNEYFRKENGDVFHQDFGAAFLNLRYKLANGKLFSEDAKIQPYLFAGPGLLKDNSLSGLSFDAGLGSKFPVSDNVALFLEAGYLSDRFNDDEDLDAYGLRKANTDNFFKVNGVVEFALGKAKDSDGDGVPDRKDKCPGTPAGVAVDANGCPLDRDGDGVPDYKDDCPDTPGLAALNGCPDKDGDGIADHLDECPDVPGLKKFNGCPDTDGDGVPDPKDECPNTPKGCTVDAKGCPLDTDKDGIIDCEDQCPTQPGTKENKGCPITCVDFDVNPVHFDFDKSELRPEGIAALDAFVTKLGDCKNYEIVVNGHTCNIGSTRYNQGLSERRAQSVVKYLLTKGVNNAYIGAKGFGETQPAVPNTNKANREQNRRAEIDLTVK